MKFKKIIGIICLCCVLTSNQSIYAKSIEQTENINSNLQSDENLEIQEEETPNNQEKEISEIQEEDIPETQEEEIAEIQEDEISDIQDNEAYYDLRENDVSEITTNCDDIKITTVEDVHANEEIREIGESTFDDSLLSELGDVDVSEEIVVGNIGIPIFPTYCDSESAINNVKAKCERILRTLQERYALPELTDDTWNIYYESMYNYLDEENKVEWYDEFDEEFVTLSNFFDIYENIEVNNYLITTAASADDITNLVTDESFLNNLPYTGIDELIENDVIEVDEDGGLIETTSKNTEKQTNTLCLNTLSPTLLSYTKANAISYAKTYAKNRNTSFGYISGADCANFASQIMLAGGKSYTTKWLTAQVAGTWHYTNAWSNANSFANYWGVDYKYSSHKNFSAKLKKGDYITEDKANDGDWDHIGFVVARKTSYSSKLKYTNYKVAQHTKNYCAWASSSTCGWDKLKSSYPNCKFDYSVKSVSPHHACM